MGSQGASSKEMSGKEGFPQIESIKSIVVRAHPFGTWFRWREHVLQNAGVPLPGLTRRDRELTCVHGASWPPPRTGVKTLHFPPLLVLGIESSCDETGVALIEGSGTGVPKLLAHALYSQVEMHEAYGGVVPELASRDHIRRVLPLTRHVLEQSGRPLSDVDVVAYTRGPGLAGALLVGAGVACALGAALGKPVLGVHHLEGHLLSPFLSADPPAFPYVALLVSGGHTQLMRVDAVGSYQLLGESIDDAAGEAFD